MLQDINLIYYVQINSVPLPLINFRKFITGDEKWILYDSKRKKSWIDPG